MSGAVIAAITAAALTGVLTGMTVGLLQNKRLRRRNRELRADKRAQNPETPAVEQMSTHERAVYYQMLDELERGEQPAPHAKRDGRGREPDRTETMKRVVWVCLAMGIAWVWCSYILAYLDHPQIAESLSQVAVTEIIGVVLAYAIKSSIENLSKHNRWPDRGDPPEAAAPDETGGEEGGVG